MSMNGSRWFLIAYLFLICFGGTVSLNAQEARDEASVGSRSSSRVSDADSPPKVPLADVDFQSDIQPLLSDYCFACHGPDEHSRAADLRLDQLDDVVGVDGPIVPRHPSESEVWRRIMSTDEDLMMPPPSTKKPLNNEQKQRIEQWIKAGAQYSSHWAFSQPTKSEPPRHEFDAWTANPIDAFLYNRMQTIGLGPNPRADRRTLLRRLSLDLTGLPPTPEEIDAFLQDTQQGAWHRQVERLLGSRRFGERMAARWLDQARYADTNGYSIDGGRSMWLWRDWVIQAFNSNLPYDQFITSQLSGDLLPNPTTAQIVATGFNRNHSITHEGGTIPEENLVNYAADRVKTFGESMLGLTLGCAQCHDHKFDPVSQRDYYQIFAYFNTLDDRGLDGDGGRNSVPAIQSPWLLDEPVNEIQQLEQELARLDESMKQKLSSQTTWEAEAKAVLSQRGENLKLVPFEVVKVTEPNRGQPYDVMEDGTVWVPSPWGRSPSFSLRIPKSIDGDVITGVRIEFMPDEKLPEGGLGHGKGNFRLTSFSCSSTALPSDQVDLYRQVSIDRITATSALTNHPPEDCLDPRDSSGWSPSDVQEKQHLTLTFETPISPSEMPYLTTMLVWGAGNGLVAGKYRFLAMTGKDDGTSLPEDIIGILNTADSERTAEENNRLQTYYNGIAETLKPTRATIASIQQRIQDLQSQHSVMVMNTSQNPRSTHLLTRGQYDQPGDPVNPDTPSSLPKLGDFPPNRLGLAQWMTHPDHPLTSRVAVNRLWEHFFGRGIVHPTADFGFQGTPPTHPQLLDYLAVEFVDKGWNVKEMIRLIVHSQAYQQTSTISEDARRLDPLNLYASHAPRFRLSAEVIRDNALFYGGLLVERVGGRPVYPYQPDGLWREVSHFGSTPATAQVYVQDHGENLYRRSLYTYWKRTVPPPGMQTFDAPNREICTMERPATNTPLQALVTLNDTQFVEAARCLAQRMLDQPGSEVERLQWGFVVVTSRLPTPAELNKLQTVLQRERVRYETDPAAAEALVSIGESNVKAESMTELAAWTVVSQLLNNLSETLTRE